MQDNGPPPRLEDRWALDSPDRFETCLQGCVLFPLLMVVNAIQWLFGRLFKNPLGEIIRYFLETCVLLLIMIVSYPYYRLRHWLNPTNVRFSEPVQIP